MSGTSGAMFLYSAYSKASIDVLQRIRSVPELRFVRCISVDPISTKAYARTLGVQAVPCILIKHNEISKAHTGFEVDVWIDSFTAHIDAGAGAPPRESDYDEDPRELRHRESEAYDAGDDMDMDVDVSADTDMDMDESSGMGVSKRGHGGSRESSKRSKALSQKMSEMMNERDAMDKASDPRPRHIQDRDG